MRWYGDDERGRPQRPDLEPAQLREVASVTSRAGTSPGRSRRSTRSDCGQAMLEVAANGLVGGEKVGYGFVKELVLHGVDELPVALEECVEVVLDLERQRSHRGRRQREVGGQLPLRPGQAPGRAVRGAEGLTAQHRFFGVHRTMPSLTRVVVVVLTPTTAARPPPLVSLTATHAGAFGHGA